MVCPEISALGKTSTVRLLCWALTTLNLNTQITQGSRYHSLTSLPSIKMQQQGRVLVPLDPNNSKLNLHAYPQNPQDKMTKTTDSSIKLQHITTNTSESTTSQTDHVLHQNKSFKLSPSKDAFFDSLSPLRSQPPPTTFNILEVKPQLSEKTLHNNDYSQSLMEVEDLSNLNKDLILEMDNLQNTLNEKDRVIHMKSIKLDELIHENNNLLVQLKDEREVSENDFNAWLDLKAALEFEIHTLRKSYQSSKEIPTDQTTSDLENFSKFQAMQTEINKLKRRTNVLMKENELEVQSKMMIMEELETMRDRYIEADTKYKTLKEDYDDLVKELLLIKQYDSEYTGYDDNSSVVTPVFGDSNNDDRSGSPTSLNIQKKRISSYDSYSTFDEGVSRIPSLRNSSLNRATREIELKAQRQKFQHEFMKYEFENKSLKLQNEKLLSFIGFSLQVKSKDFKSLANKISSSNFDYSDSHNIKSAKRNLKTVIKSVSAMPIRPATMCGSLSMSNMKNSTTNETLDDFLNNSMNNSLNNSINNSMEYSTDYEQGEMLPLELGTSDSFEEYGDDELDEDEFDEKDLLNLNNNITTNAPNNNKRTKTFSSTASLNAVYKANSFIPVTAPIINEQLTPLTPRNHIKRLTPSTFNLKPVDEKYSKDESVIENKDFVDDRDEFGVSDFDFDLDFDTSNIILNLEADVNNKLRSNSMMTDGAQSLTNICEVEDDDLKYDGGGSSYEDDDDGDEDETINISNAEIDMFKINMPKRLKCRKHSMFLCISCPVGAIFDQPTIHEVSPISSLLKAVTSGASIDRLKLMSKIITGESNQKKNNRNKGNGDKREYLRPQLFTRTESSGDCRCRQEKFQREHQPKQAKENEHQQAGYDGVKNSNILDQIVEDEYEDENENSFGDMTYNNENID